MEEQLCNLYDTSLKIQADSNDYKILANEALSNSITSNIQKYLNTARTSEFLGEITYADDRNGRIYQGYSYPNYIPSTPNKSLLDDEDLRWNNFKPVLKKDLNYMSFIEISVPNNFQWFLLTNEGSWFEEFDIMVESVYDGIQIFTSLEIVPDPMKERIEECINGMVKSSTIGNYDFIHNLESTEDIGIKIGDLLDPAKVNWIYNSDQVTYKTSLSGSDTLKNSTYAINKLS